MTMSAGGGPSAHLVQVGEITLLLGRAVREGARRGVPARELLRQLEQLGVQSLSIVAITSMFAGMVLAIQAAHSLERFGAKQFVGQVVALSLLREMGPVLTALVVAGRVGAGITAELGAMAVTEQVDAVRSLGASPVHRLVLPRLVAILIMLPLLTLLADGVGLLGGALIGWSELGQSIGSFWTTSFQQVEWSDILSGLGKSVFFGGLIGVIACHAGLSATGGADGVGRATTRAVVAASISILVSDFFLTKLFLLLP